jgi:hypothetical protein
VIRRLSASLLIALPVAAQCVMCARTAAAQNQARQTVLMDGVLILLIPPVLILSGFLVLAWRRRKV